VVVAPTEVVDVAGRGRTATSTIYGMPQAALHRAGADRVSALEDVAPAVVQLLAARRSAFA